MCICRHGGPYSTIRRAVATLVQTSEWSPLKQGRRANQKRAKQCEERRSPLVCMKKPPYFWMISSLICWSGRGERYSGGCFINHIKHFFAVD